MISIIIYMSTGFIINTRRRNCKQNFTMYEFCTFSCHTLSRSMPLCRTVESSKTMPHQVHKKNRRVHAEPSGTRKTAECTQNRQVNTQNRRPYSFLHGRRFTCVPLFLLLNLTWFRGSQFYALMPADPTADESCLRESVRERKHPYPERSSCQNRKHRR